MKRVQLLVVGLGPAGASAAKVAAEVGVDVFGIERNREIGTPVQCAEFIPIPMGAYAKLEGVYQQVIHGMKTILPSGYVYQSDFPGFMIDRKKMDQNIARLAMTAGARLKTREKLVTVDPKSSIALIENEVHRYSIKFEYLIAADGPYSKVARSMGLPALKTVDTRQYLVPLKNNYFDTDIWLSDRYPGGYAWLFPKRGLANLGLGADRIYAANLKKLLDELHIKLIQEGLVGESILSRTGGAIPVGGIRKKLVNKNIIFIGDAAGLTHPITGGGIPAAIISGELAGKAVSDALNNDEDVLNDFEEDVRDQFEPTINRAVERRKLMERYRYTVLASKDEVMRKGWIAFDEYFQGVDKEAEQVSYS